jgi:hypothetical protein
MKLYAYLSLINYLLQNIGSFEGKNHKWVEIPILGHNVL